MGSSYAGVNSFSASLTLATDDDSPSAAVFRIPNERLLDNDVHLAARTAVLESGLSGLTGQVSTIDGRSTTLERGLQVERGRYLELFEDWLDLIDNTGVTTPHVLGDSGPWHATASAFADVLYAFSASQSTSYLRISRSANTPSAGVHKLSCRGSYPDWRMNTVVRAETTGTLVEIGFAESTSSVPGVAAGSCATAYFNSGVSANWLLRTRNSSTGLESTSNTGVAVVAGTDYRLTLGHNGSAPTLSVNGATATVAGVNVPAVGDFGYPIFRMSGGASAAARVDFIHAYKAVARW